MALSQEKRYTVDDIYNLPEGIRAELIDGEMYMMAAPGTRHQEISGFYMPIFTITFEPKEVIAKLFQHPSQCSLTVTIKLMWSRIFQLFVISLN